MFTLRCTVTHSTNSSGESNALGKVCRATSDNRLPLARIISLSSYLRGMIRLIGNDILSDTPTGLIGALNLSFAHNGLVLFVPRESPISALIA